jgi:hypothetical protein
MLDVSKLDLDDVMEAVSANNCIGFCTACGSEAYNVEPDASEYKCECCGERQVYGAEELLLYMA